MYGSDSQEKKLFQTNNREHIANDDQHIKIHIETTQKRSSISNNKNFRNKRQEYYNEPTDISPASATYSEHPRLQQPFYRNTFARYPGLYPMPYSQPYPDEDKPHIKVNIETDKRYDIPSIKRRRRAVEYEQPINIPVQAENNLGIIHDTHSNEKIEPSEKRWRVLSLNKRDVEGSVWNEEPPEVRAIVHGKKADKNPILQLLRAAAGQKTQKILGLNSKSFDIFPGPLPDENSNVANNNLGKVSSEAPTNSFPAVEDQIFGNIKHVRHRRPQFIQSNRVPVRQFHGQLLQEPAQAIQQREEMAGAQQLQQEPATNEEFLQQTPIGEVRNEMPVQMQPEGMMVASERQQESRLYAEPQRVAENRMVVQPQMQQEEPQVMQPFLPMFHQRHYFEQPQERQPIIAQIPPMQPVQFVQQRQQEDTPRIEERFQNRASMDAPAQEQPQQVEEPLLPQRNNVERQSGIFQQPYIQRENNMQQRQQLAGEMAAMREMKQAQDEEELRQMDEARSINEQAEAEALKQRQIGEEMKQEEMDQERKQLNAQLRSTLRARQELPPVPYLANNIMRFPETTDHVVSSETMPAMSNERLTANEEIPQTIADVGKAYNLGSRFWPTAQADRRQYQPLTFSRQVVNEPSIHEPQLVYPKHSMYIPQAPRTFSYDHKRQSMVNVNENNEDDDEKPEVHVHIQTEKSKIEKPKVEDAKSLERKVKKE